MKKLFDWRDDDDDLDERFWGAPELWPIDTEEYVFLARALDQIGLSEHGDAWNDLGPDEPRDDTDEADTEHEDECEAAEAQYFQIRRIIRDKMIDLLRQAKLTAGFRLKEGGKIEESRVEALWNSENCARRFKRCDISIETPFPIQRTARATHYIFIKRNDLDQLLAASQSRKSTKVPRKLELCLRALRDRYGKFGPSHGTPIKEIHREVTRWAKRMDVDLELSSSYLAVALAKVRGPQQS